MEGEILAFENKVAAQPQADEKPLENLTAQGAAAQESEGAAANLGGLQKFKDIDSLVKAYSSLEAEFTRRSQRLRELEGAQKRAVLPRLETSEKEAKRDTSQAQKAGQDDDGHVETAEFENNYKLSKESDALNKGAGVLSQQLLEKETGDFLKKFPKAQKLSAEIANAAAISGDYSQGFLERAYLASLEIKLAKSEDVLQDKQKLKEYVFNSPELKEAVIKEYLNGFKGGVSLLTESGAGITMPPKKPTTISEAGNLARELLQKK